MGECGWHYSVSERRHGRCF